MWPEKMVTQASRKTEKERRAVREVFELAMNMETSIKHQIPIRFQLQKSLIILCWVKRFRNSSQLKSIGKKTRGPLPTTKKDFHVKCMIRIYQRTFESYADFQRLR